MKKITILILFLFFIACNQEKCNVFDYVRHGIDTLSFIKTQSFYNGVDTINFVVQSFSSINMKEREESFTYVKECNNGFHIEYICNKLNLSINLWYLRDNKGHYFNVWAPLFSLKEPTYFHSLNEINFTLNQDAKIKNKKTFIKKIIIHHGKIVSLIDNNGIGWNLLK
jgi:hypothetical protein